MGSFIVLYGINNIGKTTQCKRLVAYLLNKGRKATYFKSPDYALPSGKKIHAILRSTRQSVSEEEFQQLYAKNRFEQQAKVIAALQKGDVIMEDYVGTSLAWGSAKGISMDALRKMNQGLLHEDLAILLDGRRFASGKERIHLHEQNDALLHKVRRLHLTLAHKYHWHIINANQPKAKVFRDIVAVLRVIR
ncbi:hypothetical protein HY491_01865 [Candidatus Woesearchaeota archaeon]|nr:hypothetical protein [Candidatus Woesearchaeota archaeon]